MIGIISPKFSAQWPPKKSFFFTTIFSPRNIPEPYGVKKRIFYLEEWFCTNKLIIKLIKINIILVKIGKKIRFGCHGKELHWLTIRVQTILMQNLHHSVQSVGKTFYAKNIKSFYFFNFLLNIFWIFRGEWTQEEDLHILTYVKENGSKWNQMAKICLERTEHNIKNRFFSLVANHFNTSIKKIKENYNYTDPNIIEEVLLSLN